MRGVLFLASILTATAAVAFEGNYGVTFGDARKTLSIVATGPGTFAVSVEVAFPACSGVLERATGTVVGDRLSVVSRETAGTCRLDLRRRGDGIWVNETSCLASHGRTCAFGGFYPPASR